MINKILIGLMFASGIAHNACNVPGAFWVCYLSGIGLVLINKKYLIDLLTAQDD